VTGAETFRPAVGTSFAAAHVELVLASVTELSNDAFETFSLLFVGPAEPALPQGTVELTHDTLGLLALFVVPVGRDATGMRYEAVFNRLRAGRELAG